jgi:hypothetical protein
MRRAGSYPRGLLIGLTISALNHAHSRNIRTLVLSAPLRAPIKE